MSTEVDPAPHVGLFALEEMYVIYIYRAGIIIMYVYMRVCVCVCVPTVLMMKLVGTWANMHLFYASNVITSTLITYIIPICTQLCVVYTVVSRVSAHGCLNITRDFGPHGRLPGI